MLILSVFANGENYYEFSKEYRLSSPRELIKIKSKKAKINWKLMDAIAYVESNYDYKATNKYSSARGMYQFLISTTDFVSKMAGYKVTHGKVQCEVQIDLAIVYMKYLLKKYNGNTEKALIEYRGRKDRAYLKKLYKKMEELK